MLGIATVNVYGTGTRQAYDNRRRNAMAVEIPSARTDIGSTLPSTTANKNIFHRKKKLLA